MLMQNNSDVEREVNNKYIHHEYIHQELHGTDQLTLVSC